MSGRRGFTLVEVLVVVSIIALLLGILVPALGGARESARVVACQANQRSVGQGIFAYAHDFDDALPFGAQAAAAPMIFDFYPLTGYITSLLSRLDGEPVALGLMLADHLSDKPQVLFCPGTDVDAISESHLEFVGSGQAQCSYWYRHGEVFDRPSSDLRRAEGSFRLSNMGRNRNGIERRALIMDTNFVVDKSLGSFGVVTITHHETSRVNALYHDGSADTHNNSDGALTVDMTQPDVTINEAPEQMLIRFEALDAEY